MQQYRIEIAFKKKELDFYPKSILSAIKEDLGIKTIQSASFCEFFDLKLNEPEQKALQIVQNIFFDPIVQHFSLNESIEKDFDFAVEVRLHENITDNTAITAKKAIEDYLQRNLKEDEKIVYGKKFFFRGKPSEQEINSICIGLLANPQIEEFVVQKNGQKKL